MSLRDTMRHGALTGLGLTDSIFGREQKISQRRIVQVANFHHMYDYEHESFRKFLTWFRSRYQVVSYSEAVSRIKSNEIDAAYGAITFDDGLKSNVDAGRILSEFDISAAFFVCPEIVGETKPEPLRKFCQKALMSFESDEFVSWDDLQNLKKQNHEVGNHTYSHPQLANLSLDQAVEEVTIAQDVLTQKLGDIKHFAWPFGRFDRLGSEVASALLNIGFESIGSGERGAHGKIESGSDQDIFSDRLCVRRDNLEARWPLTHIKHFMTRNSGRPVFQNQWWPSDWQFDNKVKAQ